MADYRVDSLSSLARQMAFTPAGERARQLDRAEALLLTIEPGYAYAPAFLTHQITGFALVRTDYTPPTCTDATLLAGPAVRHDLGLLIERVSESLRQSTDAAGEPILTIADVADRFGVTGKTLQRWRRKGLAARRFRFPDGKSRVGFRLSSVEAYVRRHQGRTEGLQTTGGSDGGPDGRPDGGPDGRSSCPTPGVVERSPVAAAPAVADRLLPRLVADARRLADRGLCEEDVAWRLGRRLGFTPLTVRHVTRRETAGEPIAYAPPVPPDKVVTLVERFEAGETLSDLASQTRRPRLTLLRLIQTRRAARLAAIGARFHDDSLYAGREAEAAVEAIVRAAFDDAPAGTGSAGVGTVAEGMTRVPRNLPPCLAETYRTPLLSPPQERALFLSYNFRRRRFVQARRKVARACVGDLSLASHRTLSRLEASLAAATAVQHRIVRANLRLVISVARRHAGQGADLMDLVSDGHLVLLRAVNGFDPHRGNKFSTYATLALMKGYARSAAVLRATRTLRTTDGRRRIFGGDVLATLGGTIGNDRTGPSPDTDAIDMRDELGRLLGSLEPEERSAVEERFGLRDPSARVPDESAGEATPAAPTRRGGAWRRIEQGAMRKLRDLAESLKSNP